MRRLWLFLPLLLFWMLAPVPPSSQHAGAYNYTSHLMYCRTELACLHEIGHRLDQLRGFPSQSAEFCQALQLYLYVEMRKPVLAEMPASILELTYRGGDRMSEIKKEIYAYLFAWSAGKPERMPEALRSFYDWQDAQRLLFDLHEQQTLYWLN
jgi:hypothetical protein